MSQHINISIIDRELWGDQENDKSAKQMVINHRKRCKLQDAELCADCEKVIVYSYDKFSYYGRLNFICRQCYFDLLDKS